MDVFLIVFGSVMALVLYLWIDYLIAKEFYFAAQQKGYFDKKYLWLAFCLGAIGYLLVIALPDRGASENVLSDELPDL